MATNNELRTAQKEELFDLLKLKMLNKSEVKGLNELIARKRAGMEAEDVAYVEKIIAEL
ncbi:MAG: hypothetical protein LBC82_01995 [Oscillospiraceae bacterium]|jgi:hypothetical protein|nr:hypothetical protein [Oscillospiraceae bacterium]